MVLDANLTPFSSERYRFDVRPRKTLFIEVRVDANAVFCNLQAAAPNVRLVKPHRAVTTTSDSVLEPVSEGG